MLCLEGVVDFLGNEKEFFAGGKKKKKKKNKIMSNAFQRALRTAAKKADTSLKPLSSSAQAPTAAATATATAAGAKQPAPVVNMADVAAEARALLSSREKAKDTCTTLSDTGANGDVQADALSGQPPTARMHVEDSASAVVEPQALPHSGSASSPAHVGGSPPVAAAAVVGKVVEEGEEEDEALHARLEAAKRRAVGRLLARRSADDTNAAEHTGLKRPRDQGGAAGTRRPAAASAATQLQQYVLSLTESGGGATPAAK